MEQQLREEITHVEALCAEKDIELNQLRSNFPDVKKIVTPLKEQIADKDKQVKILTEKAANAAKVGRSAWLGAGKH